MNVTNTPSNDKSRRPRTQLDEQDGGDGLTTREKIATSMGLYAPSPRDDTDVGREGVHTRQMCRKLEEIAKIEAAMTRVCDRPQTPSSQSREETPSTPSTPASQIIRHDGPLETPGAPRKTRLMRIHPEEWSFGHQVARRLDIFSEDTLHRQASKTSETESE